MRPGISLEKAREVLAEKGRLSTADLVHLRVRHFSDGLVLGSKAFVESVFQENRHWFGPKRQDGARRLKECEQELFSLRRLRMRVLG